MTNAERILLALDEKLRSPVELTLYGRAALLLGYEAPPRECALSRDVDAVLWLGQAEELNERTNFWQAVGEVNEELAEDDLYISHFFTEDQVILRPDWRRHRAAIAGPWKKLALHRLGDVDLLLSKLMRDDPIDQSDARFIVDAAGLTPEEVKRVIASARVPDAAEIREQFELATRRLLASIE